MEIPTKTPIQLAPDEKISDTAGVYETETLERAEYADCVRQFAILRSKEGSLQELGEGKTEMSDEEHVTAGLQSMEASHALLQDLDRGEAITDATESVCTVTIPVAILKENLDTVVATVGKIQKSLHGGAEIVDVVLWANARYDENNQREAETKAAEAYAAMLEKTQGIEGDNLRIQTALQCIPEAEFGMSKLRSNIMDAVSIDFLEKGYGSNHPVLWLDADTTYISKGSIEGLADMVRGGRTLFAHANLQFSLDWANGATLSELDHPSKVVAINELQRRSLRRINRRVYDTYPDEYAEESGLAFSAGTYLKIGGVDTTQPLGESAQLLRRAEDWQMSELFASSDGVVYQPLLLKYLENHRVGTSARRHYEHAKRNGPYGLSNIDDSGYGELYIDTNKAELDPDMVFQRGDVGLLLAANEAKWKANNPTSQGVDKNGAKRESLYARGAEARRRASEKFANWLLERYYPYEEYLKWERERSASQKCN